MMQEYRNTLENMLLLDAGDVYLGTDWFYVYRGMAAAHFMNQMDYDAMASVLFKSFYVFMKQFISCL